jgi:hypothetical protein
MATIANDLRRSCEYPDRDRLLGADRPESSCPHPADRSKRRDRRSLYGAVRIWSRGHHTEAPQDRPFANSPAGAPRKGIGRVVCVPTRSPANDVDDPRATLLALVDELAVLAAELYVTGRLDGNHERET